MVDSRRQSGGRKQQRGASKRYVGSENSTLDILRLPAAASGALLLVHRRHALNNGLEEVELRRRLNALLPANTTRAVCGSAILL